MVDRKGTMSEADPEVEDRTEPDENPVEVQADTVSTVTEEVEDEEYDSRKMDPNLEVWDGGPNFGQINKWKDQYGDVYVTSITPTEHVAWRPITRFEYRNLMKAMEQAMASGLKTSSEANLDNEESIAELAVLYPAYRRTDGAAILGGLASTISQQVMEASGFTAVEVRQL